VLSGSLITVSKFDSVAAALVALGIKNDVDDAPSPSGTAVPAGTALNSANRSPSADFASMLGTFQVSLTPCLNNAYVPDGSSDEEDVEEDSGSGAICVTNGGASYCGGDFQNRHDLILVSDDEEDGDEEGNAGRAPNNRDNPILVTDGDESGSNGDPHNDTDENAEPRQETPTQSEENTRLSERHGRSVVPRQETPVENGEEIHPCQHTEEFMGQQQQEAEAHAEIRQRVAEYMKREAESDQAQAVTAVKRKIKDEQMEDFTSSKRYLMTLAKARDV